MRNEAAETMRLAGNVKVYRLGSKSRFQDLVADVIQRPFYDSLSFVTTDNSSAVFFDLKEVANSSSSKTVYVADNGVITTTTNALFRLVTKKDPGSFLAVVYNSFYESAEAIAMLTKDTLNKTAYFHEDNNGLLVTIKNHGAYLLKKGDCFAIDGSMSIHVISSRIFENDYCQE